MTSLTFQLSQAVGASQAPGRSASVNIRLASSRTTRRMVGFPAYVIAFHSSLMPLPLHRWSALPDQSPRATDAPGEEFGFGAEDVRLPPSRSHYEPQRTTGSGVNGAGRPSG